jgi:hypothetical protein
MEVTLGVTAVNGGRRRGRIVIGENDPSLVRYAGLAVTGELARRLRLVELIDAELSVERRARPVKVRRRGMSPGQLVVALSECQLIGGEFFSDVEEVRADQGAAGCERLAGRRRRRPRCSAPRTSGGCTASGSSARACVSASISIVRLGASGPSR